MIENCFSPLERDLVAHTLLAGVHRGIEQQRFAGAEDITGQSRPEVERLGFSLRSSAKYGKEISSVTGSKRAM